jgi:hypothetical protein
MYSKNRLGYSQVKNYSFLLIIFSSFILSSAFAQQSPQVIAIQPVPQQISALPNSEIVIDFDQPIDSLTVNLSNIRVFGRWSGPASGTFQLQNGNTRITFTPNSSFFAGEWITVSLSNNIQGVVGLNLAHGYSWNFWIATNPGTLDLQEMIQIPVREINEGHIQAYGAYGGDLNQDGWSDLVVVNEIPADVRVFLNDTTGMYDNFTIYSLPDGANPSTNEGADFDGNGIIDFAVGNTGNDKVHVLKGDGTGNFQPQIDFYSADVGIRGLAVMDLNGDGHDDIVTANRVGNNLSLLLNSGSGIFGTANNIEAGGSGETACAAADANEDGILDLFIGAYNSNELILMLGDGNGGLVYSDKVNAMGKPWMIAVGDINRDGHVDVVSANSTFHNIAISFGDGEGGLSQVVTYPVGDFPLAIDLGDIDGDEDLDLVTSSYTSSEWTIFENNGIGAFINPRTLSATSAASCATLHDRDNDGDLDMTGIDELDDLIFVFDNGGASPIIDGKNSVLTFSLKQNYPNPFNPTTTIEYFVFNPSNVNLNIYNISGELVQVLINEIVLPGQYSVDWDGTNSAGVRVSSGIYFYRLSAGNLSSRKKMLFIK